MRNIFAILLLMCLPFSVFAEPTDGTRAKIVAGVNTIACPGVPGPLCVFGDAFMIATANVDDVPAPIVAAAKYGKGHLVALGHEGYFSKAAIDAGDTELLLKQLIRYAGSGRADVKAPIRVAYYRQPDIHKIGDAQIRPIAMEKWDSKLSIDDADVMICEAGSISRFDLLALDRFVGTGGGLICGLPGWGWLQTHPGKSLESDLAANELFARAGIAWADGLIDVPLDKRLPIRSDAPSFLNASTALAAFRDEEQPGATKPSAADSNVRISQLLRCLDAIPEPHFPELRQAVHTDVMALPVPSAERPLTNESGLKRLQLAAHVRRCQTDPIQRIRAERSSELFPGEVKDSAPRIAREVQIDTAIPGWQSTGLYAPPGEPLRVTVLREFKPLFQSQVRIGAHSDRLWHLATWKRAPQIDRLFDIVDINTDIASGFGGLIYVVPKEGAPADKTAVSIAGATEAPYFILGKTKPNDWQDRIRKLPAPWAELQSEKIIITLPSENVRKLDDPTDLMKFWDRVADACADLATIPRDRRRPERYVTDVQISAGYMHAGYPIMTQLDAAPRFVDLPTLQRDGDWGMFHEIGHNHQNPDWTFDGTGEVTVNLFTMYILDTVCTGESGKGGGKMHKAMSPESRAKAEAKYKENGTKFEQWKSEPFTALIMYKQLQEAFGWEAYKKVFAEYRGLPEDQRPKTDDEKRDQWMVRFSRTVGKNLGPFFEYWGIPTSEAARKSIEELPVWMAPSK